MNNVITRDKIIQIIKAATLAPSGDNSQPWRFVVRKNIIEFHYLPEKDHPILNHEESGTLIALGAALENAELEARMQHFKVNTQLVDNGSCVAVMTLNPDGKSDAMTVLLQKAIPSRHTNRKAYEEISFSTETRRALFSSAAVEKDVMFGLIESPSTIREVARALTTMEEIALANKTLHRLFFDNILWSEKKNRTGTKGLYIKTLELPPPAQIVFRLLKNWNFARIMARIGFPRVIAKANATQNASAAAFGIISATQINTKRMTYIEVGRMLERIWLSATARGLSLQIVTGLTFLARSVNNPTTGRFFNNTERQKIQKAYDTIKTHTSKGQEPIIMFRIGKGKQPTAVTYRQTPDVTFVE